MQEQATIQASLESSQQNANHVELSGEVDLDGSSPSDDDPDDMDYKLPARHAIQSLQKTQIVKPRCQQDIQWQVDHLIP